MAKAKKRLTVKQLGRQWKKLANDPKAKEFLAMNLLLRKIAGLGSNIPEAQKDWANIGKIAVYEAAEFLKPKCKYCGCATSVKSLSSKDSQGEKS